MAGVLNYTAAEINELLAKIPELEQSISALTEVTAQAEAVLAEV